MISTSAPLTHPSHPVVAQGEESHDSTRPLNSRDSPCATRTHTGSSRLHQPVVAQAKGTQGSWALWALTFYNPNLGLPTRERRPVERRTAVWPWLVSTDSCSSPCKLLRGRGEAQETRHVSPPRHSHEPTPLGRAGTITVLCRNQAYTLSATQ